MRKECHDYIAARKDQFLPFISVPWDEFLAGIRSNGEWGDDVEIQALSEIFACPVQIYDFASGKAAWLVVTGVPGKPFTWNHPGFHPGETVYPRETLGFHPPELRIR